MNEPLRVLSLGGGTQSCALALMSAAGDLPKLDHIVFADTQGELPETYEYLDYLRDVVEAAGIPLHVVTAGSLEQALLVTQPQNHNPTLPAHIRHAGGDGRMGFYRCSWNHKRSLIERTVKQLCGGRGAWKSTTVEQWIGFSVDETGRMKLADGCRCGHRATLHDADMTCQRCACERFDRWLVNVWPLIDLRFHREDTIAWFRKNGHPTPPRSACWFCPNNGNARWQTLRVEHPDLFERACVIDDTIRNGGGYNAPGNQPFDGEMFLHAQRVPLRDADLRTKEQMRASNGEMPLFDDVVLALDCEAGVCFT